MGFSSTTSAIARQLVGLKGRNWWSSLSVMGSASALLIGLSHASAAQDFDPFFTLEGLVDLRAYSADAGRSSFDGGFGKTRFGDLDGTGRQTDLRLNEVSLIGFGQLTPSLSATAHIQFNPDLDSEFDLVEAFIRWRPVSTSRLRFSARAGAFFPIVSGEQFGIAWENLYTLTNSAANTWVAEEVRPIGLEASLEYRGDFFTATLGGTSFFGNDRSGVALAFRGWQLNGQNVGLFGDIALPDLDFGAGRQDARNSPFVESDDRPGFALNLVVDHEDHGRVIAYASFNRADSSVVGSEGRLWPTKFATLAYDRVLPGDVEMFLQGMIGETYIYTNGQPPDVLFTSFYTASALFARRFGDFQLAIRGELFEQIDRSTVPGPLFDEVGEAVTVALNWFAGDHHQVTGEVLHVNARRAGGPANTPISTNETVLQLNYRFRF